MIKSLTMDIRKLMIFEYYKQGKLANLRGE